MRLRCIGHWKLSSKCSWSDGQVNQGHQGWCCGHSFGNYLFGVKNKTHGMEHLPAGCWIPVNSCQGQETLSSTVILPVHHPHPLSCWVSKLSVSHGLLSWQFSKMLSVCLVHTFMIQFLDWTWHFRQLLDNKGREKKQRKLNCMSINWNLKERL